jgi:hypothetical protein
MPSNVLSLRPNGSPHTTYDVEKFRRFIDEKSKSHGDWQCSVFHLYHKNEASPGAVDSAYIDKTLKGTDRDQAIASIVDQFETNLKSIAAGYSTMQGFVVTAHANKDLDAPSLFQHHISFKSDRPDNIDAGEIEPANNFGALAQMQRIVDQVIASSDRKIDLMFDIQSKWVQRLLEANNERDAHILNYRLATEDLMDRRADRELKKLESERAGKFTEQMTGIALTLSSGVISKMLANKGLIDSNGVVNQDKLKIMVDELTPDQMASFVMSLSEEQKAKFEPMLGPMLLTMPEKLEAIQKAALEEMAKRNNQASSVALPEEKKE